MAQYIGEICRYLLAAHGSNGKEIPHKVRAMIGNGLRAEIWSKFKNRFDIEDIFEFYGATEGNSNLGECSPSIHQYLITVLPNVIKRLQNSSNAWKLSE